MRKKSVYVLEIRRLIPVQLSIDSVFTPYSKIEPIYFFSSKNVENTDLSLLFGELIAGK